MGRRGAGAASRARCTRRAGRNTSIPETGGRTTESGVDARAPALARTGARPSRARRRGELGQRATALLARVTWPGKADTGPAVVPLTPDEQQRFAAGREVYQTLCAACHQPDGRGREQVAPALVGSELALGPAGIAVRIVLNGKEGSTGLMPPLGAALTDEQIAAALTYIRREWGHTASPVDPSTVNEVRAHSTGRTRPWTAEELARVRQ